MRRGTRDSLGDLDKSGRDWYLQRDQFRDVRRVLEYALKDPIEQRTWQWLLDHPNWLGLVRKDADQHLGKVLQEINRWRAHHPLRDHKSKERVIGPDERLEALACIAASEAAELPRVIEFRQKVLRNELLTVDAIPAWIRARQKKEGDPTTFYAVYPLPKVTATTDPQRWAAYVKGEAGPDPIAGLSQEDPQRWWAWRDARSGADLAKWLRDEADRIEGVAFPEGITGPVERLFLQYGPRSEEETNSIAIRRDGALAYLKTIVSGIALHLAPHNIGGLCDSFGWQEHEAVAFVLSGWRPPIPKGRVGMIFGYLPALRRITMEVDFRTPSAEVARLYNEARGTLRAAQDRPLNPKTLELAIFTHEHVGSDETWSALQAEWNKKHPKNRYPNRRDRGRRFALDCRNAWSRVTGLDWHPSLRLKTAKGSSHGRRETDTGEKKRGTET
jgi:hypothetical protein